MSDHQEPIAHDDPDLVATLAAVVRVPPLVLMQAVSALITQYVTDAALELAEEPDVDEDDPGIAHAMSTAGLVEHFAEVLELDDAMREQFRAFLDDEHVQKFTHFPPTFEFAPSDAGARPRRPRARRVRR